MKNRNRKKIKGGDCGCSRITGGSNFFQPTAIGAIGSVYPANNYVNDPSDPSQMQSVRTNPDIPFSARGGGGKGGKGKRKTKRKRTRTNMRKKYCKGGNHTLTHAYTNDLSIIQAPTRILTGGKKRTKKANRKCKKGGDMLTFFNTNPITSFGSTAGLGTFASIASGQGQHGDQTQYNMPLNNPIQQYYV